MDLFMSFLPLVMLIAMIYLVFKVVMPKRGKITTQGTMICAACGTRCDPATAYKGSLGVEIVLWLCFIVPGLIYSLWRLSSKRRACPTCGSTDVIPVSTPRGQEFVSSYHQGSEQPAPPHKRKAEPTLEELLKRQ